jgi:tRNA(Glu) U13 pseudouridine synthase TruD
LAIRFISSKYRRGSGNSVQVTKFQARTARRALRARVDDLQWLWLDDTTLRLDFTLGRGVYATSLLHALGDFSQYDKYGSAGAG